jgi:rhodanese-related sulfurtransferase
MNGYSRYPAYLFWVLILALIPLLVGLQPEFAPAAHDQEDVIDIVTPERLKYYLDNKEPLVIIDLRSPKEYTEKRLPGARSIPIKELEKNLRAIPRAGRVILYCDCPQNVIVQDAYQVLKDDHGYRNISIMPEGFKGWLKRKFPTEAGAKTN